MATHTRSITKAIVELQAAIEILDKKINQRQRNIDDAKLERQAIINELVDKLLPDLYNLLPDLSTERDRLERIIPSFFTPDVVEFFQKPRGLAKLIGFFIVRDQTANLELLRIKLRATIDGLTPSELLQASKSKALSKTFKKLIDINGKLSKLNSDNEWVVARSKLRAQLAKLQPTNGKAPQVARAIQPYKETTTTKYADDDVNDIMTNLLWIEMLTPSSQPQPVFQGAGGTFAGGGASDSWDATSSPSDRSLGINVVIATDDSLGRFS